MSKRKKNPCMLCGNPTSGSTGAAGIRWKSICQPCKDAEDRAVEAQIQSLGFALNKLFPKP